jgi:hypothetical protein
MEIQRTPQSNTYTDNTFQSALQFRSQDWLKMKVNSPHNHKSAVRNIYLRILTRLRGLVVRVPGYRSGSPGFDSRHYKGKVVGLERGPLNLVSTTEELLERNSSGSGLENRDYCCRNRHADHVAPSIRKKVGTNFADKLSV